MVYLCEGNLPFDLVNEADDEFRSALVIIKGEHNGGTMDWSTGRWKPRP
jgi:hypothetical protein